MNNLHLLRIPILWIKHQEIDKNIIKLTKWMYNLPKSTTNILTHLFNQDFGINTTSILPN